MREQKIAIIGGTGDLGFGLALRWALAGVQVIIGSRDENKAKGGARRIEESLKAHAPDESGRISISGMENAQAAAQAAVSVLAVPISAQAEILKSIRGSLTDAVLVDATVPLAAAVGGKPTRTLQLWQGSAAEQARELVPATTRVLAAFHNVSAGALQDLSLTPECDVFVCGDNQEAKQILFPLVKLIPGLRPIDAGPLEMSRIVEGITALLISVNRRHRVHHSGIRITGLNLEP
ncbi:MAG: NADPH-dependent F420 reductase [Candidatus Acidiferrales bacterium]